MASSRARSRGHAPEMSRPAGARWDFDLGRDTRIVFIRQDNLNKMTAGFFPLLGRVASPGDIVVINSGLHYNNDYGGAARPEVSSPWQCGRQHLAGVLRGWDCGSPKRAHRCCCLDAGLIAGCGHSLRPI